ncbi:hypothetical protein BH10BAC3_BH10BAC3_22540 [soil metagenome]
MRFAFLFFTITATSGPVFCQQLDCLKIKDSVSVARRRDYILNDSSRIVQRNQRLKSLIIPAVLVTYGFVALETKPMRQWDYQIKNEIREDNPTFHTKIDNYLQYSPAALVYGLNAVGIHGKNNFRDRTMIYLMANTMMSLTVESIKKLTKSQRPDGYGTNAFPSGHTATAFVAAEFLRMEYKDVSPWYGIGGYAAATATGILRMYNNKHWFRDILPGAGFGILSTKVSYWMYPAIKRWLFKDKPATAMIAPYYVPHGAGLSMVYLFKK